ncbi:tRNA guanylyltransferase [Ascoidea rubescens DSM 1968]|uniref:tRNA(His) guanylyltransferase n=1 Tax=Ascoidea rubescens DSM 1968 TaxID=1344418 RepID=A0A1D2VE37_9ASCO|nr:tRNAHis guanylyltransferase [Ascoidea rubescens DSM 1968]ODV59852.1 tRNAHis guanylyltransferase [Ascoidea rubescens DSM 1968]
MAKSRFEYVKEFEKENYLLQNCYIIIRIDGKNFHKFSKEYQFEKPNDSRALNLMNKASLSLFSKFNDVIMAYGDSDEYSFLLRKNTVLYERRESKLNSIFVSFFTAYYNHYWNEFFPDNPLDVNRLPTFDSRCILYPSAENVKDYFKWRQVDCHINNLYNTTFWTLIEKGKLSPKEAENKLIGTLSSDKNEILFSQFGINYNNEKEIYKKGTIITRDYNYNKSNKEIENENENENKNKNTGKIFEVNLTERQKQRENKKIKRAKILIEHIDLIKDDFWKEKSIF